jgi:hypothetical protein
MGVKSFVVDRDVVLARMRDLIEEVDAAGLAQLAEHLYGGRVDVLTDEDLVDADPDVEIQYEFSRAEPEGVREDADTNFEAALQVFEPYAKRVTQSESKFPGMRP